MRVQAHLIDFGLIGRTGSLKGLAGTQIYMPPEKRSKLIPVHFASTTQDVYAFGVTLGNCYMRQTDEIERLCTSRDASLRITMEQAHKELLKLPTNAQ